jgi:teichuronic acid biosynthesis glycosyltransferase TuaG
VGLEGLREVVINKHGNEQEIVDVVMPTFEDPHRTLKAVDSALFQSKPVSNIHVLDDGSSTEAVEKMRGAFRLLKGVELHTLPHSGHPGAVRRIGVQESGADWIAFLDADDYWDSDRIYRQLELAAQSGAGLIYSNAWVEKDGKRFAYFSPIIKLPRKLNTLRLLTSNYVINSSVLVRREHLLAVGGYADTAEVRAVEDYATWLRLSTMCEMVGIQDPLLTYTQSESSFSRLHSNVHPVNAIRDFRSWVARGKMPGLMKAKYIFLASLMIGYHKLRQTFSTFRAGLKAVN